MTNETTKTPTEAELANEETAAKAAAEKDPSGGKGVVPPSFNLLSAKARIDKLEKRIEKLEAAAPAEPVYDEENQSPSHFIS